MGQPCSDDDLSDDDGDGDIFDTENVIVCQYDKISRSRNRWKFTLKVSLGHHHFRLLLKYLLLERHNEAERAGLRVREGPGRS